MTDEAIPTPPPPMANSTEARTTTGEIIDVSAVEQPAPAPAGPPETYDFRLPEGQTIDPEILKDATPIFRELGLPQEAAQKLVDLYTKQTTGTREAALAAVEKMRGDWVGEIRADKELGGVLDTKVLPEIGRLKDRLPADVRDAFNAAMDFTGAGDHPAVVRALYSIAKIVSEGSHVTGNAASPHGQTAAGKATRPSLAGAMYPNLQ